MPESSPQVEVKRTESRALNAEARAHFQSGLEAIEQGDYTSAQTAFSRAAEAAPESARVQSYLGLATAYSSRDFSRAKNLCEAATKREFFNPDVYLNLALVYLAFDRRAEALRYLRRGKMIDPGHQEIARRLGQLGRRRLPIVPFLPRRHPVNRALGEARALLRTRVIGRRAA